MLEFGSFMLGFRDSAAALSRQNGEKIKPTNLVGYYADSSFFVRANTVLVCCAAV